MESNPINIVENHTTHTQYMNNTKVSHSLADDEVRIGNQVSSYDVKLFQSQIVNIDIWSEIEEDSMTQGYKKITQEDINIMDAIYTLYVRCPSNNVFITTEMIIRTISGNKNQDVTKNRYEKVDERIEVLRNINMTITYSNEIKVTSYLLPLAKVEAKLAANGRIVKAYEVLDIPILYKYASEKRQIISIPNICFETQYLFYDTADAINIKRYVIKRVFQIINKNRLTENKISLCWYDKSKNKHKGLYPELGFYEQDYADWKAKKKQINKIVKATLDHLASDRVGVINRLPNIGTEARIQQLMDILLLIDYKLTVI